MYYTAAVSNEVMAEGTSHTTVNILWTKDKKYFCWVIGTTKNFTLDTSSIEVAGLTPDTVYSIRCVEVDEDGDYQCTEINIPVVTGEKNFFVLVCHLSVCSNCIILEGSWFVSKLKNNAFLLISL